LHYFGKLANSKNISGTSRLGHRKNTTGHRKIFSVTIEKWIFKILGIFRGTKKSMKFYVFYFFTVAMLIARGY